MEVVLLILACVVLLPILYVATLARLGKLPPRVDRAMRVAGVWVTTRIFPSVWRRLWVWWNRDPAEQGGQ